MDSASKKSLLGRIGEASHRIELAIGSVAFALMCLFVLTTIVYRYILHMPIMWTEEASRYLMITGIFIVMPVAVREHVHLGVEVFINALPKKVQMILGLLSDIVSLAAYLAIDYACYKFVVKTLAGSQTSPAMHIPIVIMYLIIMAGFVLGTISQIVNMIEDFKAEKGGAET